MKIGSDRARVWARELPLRNCGAKAILLALANYVDDDGSSCVSLATLASDTDQSEATVRRKLQWLEGLGVVARFSRWIDDAGRVNQEGKGRRTWDRIRPIYDID